MKKKVVAREWLYFLFWFLLGLAILPGALATVFAPPDEVFKNLFGYRGFYPGLLEGRGCWFRWLIVLTPYILFQVVRSMIWAIKTVTGKTP